MPERSIENIIDIFKKENMKRIVGGSGDNRTQ